MAKTTALYRVKQMIAEPTFYKVLQGGMSSGKTYAVMTLLLTGYMPSRLGCLITVVGQTYDHLKGGTIRDMKNILKEVDYWYPEMWNISSKTLTYPNGAQLEFRSVDNMTARGPRRDVLYVNEANGINLETFQELAGRTKDFCILDFNPTAKFWAHEEYVEKKAGRTSFEIFTYEDNEGLDEMERENILEHKPKPGEKPSNWWRVYGMGQVGELEGNVYSGWTEVGREEIVKNGELIRYGLDFGFGHPTALVGIYELPDGEIGITEEIYQTGINAGAYPAALERFKVDPTILIVADSARPEIISDIRRAGYRIIGANKDKGSVERGIMRVQEKTVKFSGKHLKSEYLSYHWRTKRSTGETIYEPEKSDDDAMDALRYAIDDLYRPRFDF